MSDSKPVIPHAVRAANQSRLFSTPAWVLRVLVLAAFVLCMSAPEELFYSQLEEDLNPFAGWVKLALLAIAAVILLLSRGHKNHWAIAGPFVLLISWTVICWLVSGAEMVAARTLVSSFGGILVLAGLCSAAKDVGGVRSIARLLIWALLITVASSVFLGVAGLQPLPGESRLPGELEWFHGVGLPFYAVAGCAALVAWFVASHLAGLRVWLASAVLLLLVIPALAFLRAFLIGIVVSIVFAAVVPWWHARRKGLRLRRYKRVLFLATATVLVGAAVFVLKTDTREEGDELSGREIIWPIEVASIIQHPLFGLGPFGDVELLRFKEDLPHLGAAHSDYLGSAVCYGIPGLVLFVGTLLLISGRIARYTPKTVEEAACRYAALFSLVGVSTTMIAENVIRDPRLFTLHLLFPAMCLSAAGIRHAKANQ